MKLLDFCNGSRKVDAARALGAAPLTCLLAPRLRGGHPTEVADCAIVAAHENTARSRARTSGWSLLIPPVFSPMGDHPRSFNDLSAPLNRWDIWASFDLETDCEKEKQRIRDEAPLRLKFAQEHPEQDRNGNIVAVSEAWQMAECVATDDPRLKGRN
jgi:hypothetical protein